MLVIHDMGQSVDSELMKRQQEGKLSFHINHAIDFNGSTLINLVQLNELQKALLAMPEEPLKSRWPTRGKWWGPTLSFTNGPMVPTGRRSRIPNA